MRPLPISVVVPTRDRLGSLRGALAALAALEPPVAEVLVVDDGSRDGTAEYLAGRAAHPLTPLRTPGVGPAGARNAALRRVRTPFVACTDDDCRVSPDWAARLLRRLEETAAAAVGGRVRATGSRAARVAQAITNGLVSTLNRSPDSAEFLTSNNVGYRMDALREAGLFDASFTAPGAEERELHARLRARGARLVYDAEILVEHRPDLTWAGFVRQQAAYGSGARRFRRGLPPEACKFGRFLSPRQYGAAVRGAWREVPPRDRPALLAGCLISQAAVCWGYLRSPS